MNSSQLDLDQIVNSIKINNIDSKKNFWMIRTRRGFFYNEFIENKYVALGWNVLDANRLDAIENEEDQKRLKEELEYTYRTTKNQGTQILNKCIRFMKEIQPGDIIMIPNSGSEEITFAVAGEYYEVDGLDYRTEVGAIKHIEADNDKMAETLCPYKKRRKIDVVKSVRVERLNPNLYKALASVHEISRINDYSDYILSSMYNLYYRSNKINLVFNVEEEGAIDAIALSSFMFHSTYLIKDFTGEEGIFVSTKANLNSPGDLVLSMETLKNGAAFAVDVLKSNKVMVGIVLLWLSIVGGKFGIIEIKSVIELYLKWRLDHSKLKTDKLEQEMKEMQLLKEKAQMEEEISGQLRRIEMSSEILAIKKDDINNVIDLSSYRSKKDE